LIGVNNGRGGGGGKGLSPWGSEKHGISPSEKRWKKKGSIGRKKGSALWSPFRGGTDKSLSSVEGCSVIRGKRKRGKLFAPMETLCFRWWEVLTTTRRRKVFSPHSNKGGAGVPGNWDGKEFYKGKGGKNIPFLNYRQEEKGFCMRVHR